MSPDTAIRRLSFAEARASGSEALILVAKHRNEVVEAARENRIEAKTDEFARRARSERHHAVDKTV